MSKRAYICEECGSEMDRNMNAAINIREQAKRLIGLAWRTDLAVVSIAYAYR
ncbi:MAG: transposase [Eubacteriaceae bacterium]|nr:transposase [Eubacteriaceae bacterium]